MAQDELELSAGAAVMLAGEPCRIKACLSFSSVLLIRLASGEEVVAALSDLVPPGEVSEAAMPEERGTVRLSEAAWQEARRREAAIRPLAAMAVVPAALADAAAMSLGLSQRSIYAMVRRYRVSGGLLTSLARRPPSGGKEKGRLPAATERLIADAVADLYLTKQRLRVAAVIEAVNRRCAASGIKPPSSKAVRSRIQALGARAATTKRYGREAARRLDPVTGAFPAAPGPLDVVQIDHTPVDLIIVDEVSRRPIGRPFLTAAVDTYSRCIAGFCLTLEAPSATSVGLCLSHAILDKDEYLARLGVEGAWPIWGKPGTIHVDNAAEFHSEALRRGCEQHGIRLDYRPARQPWFGGIVERLIGTLMQHVHTLPGTTFSNITERGAYDSDGHAVLSLAELERWLATVIVGHYHNRLHAGLDEPPIERFTHGVLGTSGHPGPGPRPRLRNRRALLIDFLPIERRTIQRHGFVLDRIGYYSNALRPWIAERAGLARFVIRRDPRDISRIFVLPPEGDAYLEVPYRTLSHPAITLWEQRAALQHLRAQGKAKVDEAAIFRAVDSLRRITDEAASRSRAARRCQARTANALPAAGVATGAHIRRPGMAKPSEHAVQTRPPAQPFPDIEEW